MEDFERAAMVTACHHWFTERLGFGKLPLGPSQILFWDTPTDETDVLFPDEIWHHHTVRAALVEGCLLGFILSLFIIVFTGAWSLTALFWSFLIMAPLLCFPCAMMYRSRNAVILEDHPDEDYRTLRQMARAYHAPTLSRRLLHIFANTILFPARIAWSAGVAERAVRAYAEDTGRQIDESSIPPRVRRGMELSEKLGDLATVLRRY